MRSDIHVKVSESFGWYLCNFASSAFQPVAVVSRVYLNTFGPSANSHKDVSESHELIYNNYFITTLFTVRFRRINLMSVLLSTLQLYKNITSSFTFS